MIKLSSIGCELKYHTGKPLNPKAKIWTAAQHHGRLKYTIPIRQILLNALHISAHTKHFNYIFMNITPLGDKKEPYFY
jgi:hypothetical protein